MENTFIVNNRVYKFNQFGIPVCIGKITTGNTTDFNFSNKKNEDR